MDDLDQKLLAALKRDGRASLSELAADLKVTRTTVRSRMAKLAQTGDIAGYTVLTRSDIAASPVRGLMMLGIEGRGTEKIIQRLVGMAQVSAVHSMPAHLPVCVWLPARLPHNRSSRSIPTARSTAI